ncbi:MAG TPA: HAMP domain-containing protein [Geobacteraceae bacterium]|nr:HAMP domain-containing protein [Geobacteraceae bacterium]
MVQKLVIVYVSLSFFTMAALLFAAGGLYYLNRTARDIANNHMPAISALPKLRNAIIAQEGYAGKYAILKSSEFKELFSQREKEFADIVAVLERSGVSGSLSPLKKLYGEYLDAASALFASGAGDTVRLRGTAQKILDELDRLYVERQHDLQAKLEDASRQKRSAVTWTFVITLTGFILAIVIAVIFTYRTFAAVRKLQRATHRIAEGDFDYDPQIPPGDEIGDLAADFNRMVARLKELEQMSLDASPLTRLPGNIAIEREINRRLQEGNRFALCYADLDNFKSYTDKYGYIKGSELIRLTGEIVYEVVKDHAGSDAFVGHVGGDDFVAVLPADRAEVVCKAVIAAFDAEVVKHYTPEDLGRGGIEGEDRYGVHRFFPIMTISIAVIINEPGEFTTAVELARTAAEIKDYAKEKPGSNYLVSHRRKHPR